MDQRFIKNLIRIFALILLITPWEFVLKKNYTFANTFDKSIYKIKSNQKPKTISSNYILDNGDIIFINFIGANFYNNKYEVNPEGEINLPEINKINVRGLTLKELETLLTKKYDEFLFNSELVLSIVKYRPLQVYVKGEVKRPGLYNFGPVVANENFPRDFTGYSSNISSSIKSNPEYKVTYLFDVLKTSYGVTNYADLSKVIVIRKNAISQGGGKIQAEINLLSLLIDGDQDQNIRIYDGDTIIVPKSTKLIKDQLLTINKSNLSPEIMTVFITGNVFKTGALDLSQGSSLNQAIASSGGKKLLTGKIEFIRFDDDGTSIRKKFNYDPNAPINSKNNPILMSGDIVNVEKTLLGNASTVIGEVSSPILGGFAIYKIFSD